MSCSFYLLPGFPGSKEVPERSRGVAECSVFPGISRFPILEGKKKKKNCSEGKTGEIRVLTLPQYSYLFFEQNAFMVVLRLSSTWPLLK